MNSEETKYSLQEKMQKLLSSVNDLLQQDDKNTIHFHADLCKSQLISLYNDICEFQNQPEDALSLNSVPVSDYENHTVIDSPVTGTAAEPDIPENENTDKSIPELENIEVNYDIPEGYEVTDEVHNCLAVQPLPVTEAIQNEPAVHSENVQEQQKQTASNSDPSTKQTLSEKLQNESQLLNQRFTAESKNISVGARIQGTPVTNLKKAIGINDRFSFISELFNGDKSGFENFLDSICVYEKSSEILAFFHNETTEKNWRSKPSFSRLDELIQRYAMSK